MKRKYTTSQNNQQKRNNISLKHIMCTPVCAALGYLPQGEFDEEVARKDAEVYHSLCFCCCFREVHLLWCIFISFLRAFLATSFPGLDPRALVVIIIFMIVIIIERV